MAYVACVFVIANIAFLDSEYELLQRGFEECGHFVEKSSIKNDSEYPLLTDKHWEIIQSRFLPHKTVKQLQAKICKMRQNNQISKHAFRHRAPKKLMNLMEISLLKKGISMYGLGNWALISKNILPMWTREQLRKQYYRKIEPNMANGELEKLLHQFETKWKKQLPEKFIKRSNKAMKQMAKKANINKNKNKQENNNNLNSINNKNKHENVVNINKNQNRNKRKSKNNKSKSKSKSKTNTNTKTKTKIKSNGKREIDSSSSEEDMEMGINNQNANTNENTNANESSDDSSGNDSSEASKEEEQSSNDDMDDDDNDDNDDLMQDRKKIKKTNKERENIYNVTNCSNNIVALTYTNQFASSVKSRNDGITMVSLPNIKTVKQDKHIKHWKKNQKRNKENIEQESNLDTSFEFANFNINDNDSGYKIFPQLTGQQEIEYLRNPSKLQQLRLKIMQIQTVYQINDQTVQFFNPNDKTMVKSIGQIKNSTVFDDSSINLPQYVQIESKVDESDDQQGSDLDVDISNGFSPDIDDDTLQLYDNM